MRPRDEVIDARPLSERLIAEAKAEGFVEASVIDIERGLPALRDHVARYDRWLAAGFAGEMGYLARGRDRRADPRLVLPDAKSILIVLSPYTRQPLGSTDPAVGARYARYLQGRDYHKSLPERLERAMARVGEPGLEHKVCVDTSAVLERSWAALAGLGWIGKNTLLIHPKHGSYQFIACVLLNRETGVGPQPMKDLCGHCERCLQGCPTKAIVDERWLDSRKCISYRTLEHRGPLDDGISHQGWIAGCDVCQEVCPFNTKPARETVVAEGEDVTRVSAWAELEAETEEQYKLRVRESSLSRVKPQMVRRNLALARKS